MPRLPLALGLIAAVATGVAFAADPTSSTPPPAPIPAGFRLAYEQHFDTAAALRGFAMSDTNAWEFAADGQSLAMELARQSKYQASVRSPFNIALVADHAFGDFVLEADLVQTGKEYGHRDMCLFFGFQDPTHFYYVHLATAADDHAHNIFIVNGAPRTKIARETTKGVNWGLDIWHKVRLERRLADGAVRVYFDDLTRPIMVAEDKTFGAGWIGFGSFDDTGKVDNIRVWSSTSPEARPVTFFSRGGRP